MMVLISCKKTEVPEQGYFNPIPIDTVKITPVTLEKYDYLATNADELISALDKAKPGEVVFIDKNAQIDLSNSNTISLRRGVKLYSSRGVDESLGGLVYSNNPNKTMFSIIGDNVRISGVRIQGPHGSTTNINPDYYVGIQVTAELALIDNCEIFGWPYAAVKFRNTHSGHISACYLHHNQNNGLGYGVVLERGYALIDYNYFDYNRHAIAGDGRAGTSYDAAYNTILSHGTAHSFDMHGSEGDNQGIGGTAININNNTFYMRNFKAITIRATPEKELIIKDNRFVHPNEQSAISILSSGNFGSEMISDNTFNIPPKEIIIQLHTEVNN
ncbi:right-handed parallel beta-helix repeat-containing protein [Solitalea koreensis]|nr:right-handed parallel beta-helix repeat-containing protein [Solitalea koreensis]